MLDKLNIYDITLCSNRYPLSVGIYKKFDFNIQIRINIPQGVQWISESNS